MLVALKIHHPSVLLDTNMSGKIQIDREGRSSDRRPVPLRRGGRGAVRPDAAEVGRLSRLMHDGRFSGLAAMA